MLIHAIRAMRISGSMQIYIHTKGNEQVPSLCGGLPRIKQQPNNKPQWLLFPAFGLHASI